MSEDTKEVRRVKAESLPCSLRHNTQEEALHDAKALLCLIEDFVNCARARDNSIPAEMLHGIELVIRLARDKADIGTGAYLFPLVGNHEDGSLCERVKVE